MTESKNFKLKLGLCGLALTSFLALNTRSNTVHADTVSGSNASAITWDVDNDDSQVAHEDSQRNNASQSVQTQGAVQDQKAPATQSVQSNVQKRAETSAVRVSNFDTSTVNRLNANSVRNSQVKVATVHDTAQMPVQKQKVAQFNQGSKIYTLNGSNQLSKNNGDGYVITNAGMYNGRAVDIGVTINNVQNNQGTYTTKWSNGEKADVTGKTDANFKYQDSVLLNQQAVPVTVNKTRNRSATVTHNYNLKGYYIGMEEMGGNYPGWNYVLDPKMLAHELSERGIKPDDDKAILKVVGEICDLFGGTDVTDGFSRAANHGGEYLYTQGFNTPDGASSYNDIFELNHEMYSNGKLVSYAVTTGSSYICVKVPEGLPSKSDRIYVGSGGNLSKVPWDKIVEKHPRLYEYKDDFNVNNLTPYTVTDTETVQDNLQIDQSTPASLGYNYTVGLYDAQTGDLITDLKAEYKGKAGTQATASTNVMNSAIKNKIQQINQGKATVSYTGTSANDDVAFYQETRQVNPQDKNVNRQVQRVIHINFPNGVKPKSYDNITDSAGNKLTLDSNNNLTQSMSFTRTGVQNIVSGHVTYGNWQQHGSINAVTLPSIPGYTMVTNN